MLSPETKIAIYMEEALGLPEGKMGYGVLRYSPNQVVAVIDSKQANKQIHDFIDTAQNCAIVTSIEDAKALGAEAIILGIAPTGGHIPDKWYQDLDQAVKLGFSIVNGLHDPLSHRYDNLPSTQWVWDVRQEPSNLPVAKGEARTLNNHRVLFIGSDMAVGKMTAALELYRLARDQKIKTDFVATGQIGITITGQGIPLDAIRLDFACGAVEQAVMSVRGAELIIIEGQGSLVHPGSTATLPLIKGSMPTHFVFCHRAGQTHLAKIPDIAIPPLSELIKLYEELASVCGTFPRPKCIGICLNTAHLNDSEAIKAISDLQQETGLPVWDVVRDDASALLRTIQSAVHAQVS